LVGERPEKGEKSWMGVYILYLYILELENGQTSFWSFLLGREGHHLDEA